MKKISKLFALLAASASLSLGFLACSSDGEMYDMSPKFWEVSKISLDGLYFRGSPNDWTTTALTKASDGSYSVEFQADADSIQFKFSDSDWTKSKTYAADVMTLGTAPSGVTLTAVDDNNGGFNAKLAGLSKDSKYKLTATPTNDSKLTIALASSNYTLFSLAGYMYQSDIDDLKGKTLDFNATTEDAKHSLSYTQIFTADKEEGWFAITANSATGEWKNVFCGANSVIVVDGNEVILKERTVSGSAKAYNTDTSAYVDITKNVEQRVPKFNPFGKTGSDYEEFAKTYKSELSVKTVWRFNTTGKTVVAPDPYTLEDGTFAAKWNKLTAEEKAKYANASSALVYNYSLSDHESVKSIATLVTASTQNPSISSVTGIGCPGKLTEYAANTYYPSEETATASGNSNATIKGLTAGKKYKLTLKVTTAGVVSVKVENYTFLKIAGCVVVGLDTSNFTDGTKVEFNGSWAKDGDGWADPWTTIMGTVKDGIVTAKLSTPATLKEAKEYEVLAVGLKSDESQDWDNKRLAAKYNVDGNAKINITNTELDTSTYLLYANLNGVSAGDLIDWKLVKVPENKGIIFVATASGLTALEGNILYASGSPWSWPKPGDRADLLCKVKNGKVFAVGMADAGDIDFKWASSG